jgi:hypothetical protein
LVRLRYVTLRLRNTTQIEQRESNIPLVFQGSIAGQVDF